MKATIGHPPHRASKFAEFFSRRYETALRKRYPEQMAAVDAARAARHQSSWRENAQRAVPW